VTDAGDDTEPQLVDILLLADDPRIIPFRSKLSSSRTVPRKWLGSPPSAASCTIAGWAASCSSSSRKPPIRPPPMNSPVPFSATLR